ncbi:MAG: carboxymuconolactone decarboxylase family protein [Bradyrhizobium sp.]|uniref:carboxymuconolactone decarboxylase family protein n=1 Tax=Bradyrhizobium sp. TaxID=376 RepID=UPI0025C583D4|nr:carboxymuconolactone decarboxylase family protein [Bradyrhizobium sp.]MBI5260970.1 carboxymuconolactone decarboxylase family protein [Bradyrhizobium sp.]
MKEIAKLTLAKMTSEAADPRAREAMDGVRKSLGFVPNMYANMANSPSVLETYLTGYKYFRADGGFAPAEQEVIFLTVSRENGCEYCMAAHSMVGEKMSGVPAPDLKALRAGEPLPNAKLQALSEFARIMVANRGKPTPAELKAFLAAGYSEQHVLAIILAIAVKTISNYANHVFHTEVDQVFAAYRWDVPKAA